MLNELLKDIFSSQYFGVLSTDGNGQPYSNLVAFAFTDDLKSIIFVTSRNTSKYRNIIDNQRVSILIDNRTNNPADIEKATAITVLGYAHAETDCETIFHSAYLNRHPHLSRFISNPENALIVVTVAAFIIARFDSTQRVEINALHSS